MLLEPVGELKVTVPDSYMGDVIGDLNKRRGRVMGMNPAPGGEQIIEAEVPMAEMTSYAIDLRAMTQSRGSFTFHFVRYEDCPPHGSGEGNRRRQGAGRGRLIPNAKQPPQPGRLFLWGRSSGRGSAPAHLRRSSILPKAKSRRRADLLRPRISKKRSPRQRLRWWGGTAPPMAQEKAIAAAKALAEEG